MTGFSTRAGAAWRRITVPRQRGLAPPIHQSATFAFDDVDDFASVAQSKISGGYLYSRWANPTVDAVGEVVADLEGAEATACYASGMAAIAGTLFPLLAAGDHVVAATQVYGGTHGLLGIALPRAGVSVARRDVHDLAGIEEAIEPGTRVLYVETIANPGVDVADLDALARIARAHDLIAVVDATFTPPCLLRPLEHGFDLVIHSATKYLSGHSDVTAGVVSGSAERIAELRREQIDTGGVLAPFEAWLLARGIATLDVRMDRICSNAMALARMLEDHPAVERVLYPGLESHRDHDLARKLLGDRFGGMLACEVRGGYAAGKRALERIEVLARAASLGGTKTLMVHPASVTHTQLDAAAREAAGISDGMLRISVGIEDPADLLEDVDRALA
jgi:methionine-gamma-lyase